MSHFRELTPQLVEQLLGQILVGCSIATACRCVGIDRSSYAQWILQGRHDRQSASPSGVNYADFAERIQRARAGHRVRLIRRLREQMQTDWRAARWVLERRFPHRYGKTDRHTLLKARAESGPEPVTELRFVDDYINGKPYLRSFRAETCTPVNPESGPVVIVPPMSEFYPDSWQDYGNPHYPLGGGRPIRSGEPLPAPPPGSTPRGDGSAPPNWVDLPSKADRDEAIERSRREPMDPEDPGDSPPSGSPSGSG